MGIFNDFFVQIGFKHIHNYQIKRALTNQNDLLLLH